jgi:hypothetical protein
MNGTIVRAIMFRESVSLNGKTGWRFVTVCVRSCSAAPE